MAIPADHLVEIRYDELPILKDMYNSKGLKTRIAYTTIDNYMRWLEQGPEEYKYIKFFCLNGDFSDGTFVVTDRHRAYADTLGDSYDNLKKLLQVIDYTNGYFFLSVRDELRPVFRAALEQVNIGIGHEYKNLLYHLPKEVALKNNINPDDVELRSITEIHDLEKVNSKWSLASATSIVSLQQYAKYNINCGAFRDDGTMVAWVFRYADGVMGILQTDEQYLRRGYGSLVLKAAARKVAQMGHDIYSAVNEANIPSQKVVDRVGYNRIGYVYCIVTENAWNAIFP